MLQAMFGNLGQLVGFPCTYTEKVSHEPRYATQTTVEGRRRAQVLPSPPRSWSVTMPLADGGDLAAVSAFTTGAWGPGPWHWIPVQAQRGNLLTPREAGLAGTSRPSGIANGGPVPTPEGGWAPNSLNVSVSSSTVYYRGIPVIPGISVTHSADLTRRSGTPGLTIGFYAADGSFVGAASGSGVATGEIQRVSVTAVVPDGAATMGIGVQSSVATLSRPQVTWTDRQVPYSTGHGCRAAIIDGLTDDLIAAWDISRGPLASAAFTVMEVD